MAASSSTRRAQETANTLRMESLEHFSEFLKVNTTNSTSNHEATGMLDGFSLNFNEYILDPSEAEFMFR
ncbi:MAG: hypothetical protein K2X27_15140 [Candidatus Obscuribacterales bacterium]|nr:hypothetical protein [Candidatus Obscuribacterales bacterium]